MLIPPSISLSADDHVAATILACSKSLYALQVLGTHGMPRPKYQHSKEYKGHLWYLSCSTAVQLGPVSAVLQIMNGSTYL